MKNLLPALLFACGFLAAGAAVADPGPAGQAVLSCRALSDTARRLACYDAIPVGAPASVPVATPEQRFGLRPAVKKQKDVEPGSIRSTVVGRFDGWVPGAMITLANGQVWKVTDDTDAVLPIMQDPKVEITHGLLGAYFLQVEGFTNGARVTRVK